MITAYIGLPVDFRLRFDPELGEPLVLDEGAKETSTLVGPSTEKADDLEGRSKASAMPLDFGLSIVVHKGSKPISRADQRVSVSVQQEPLSVSHPMALGNRMRRPEALVHGRRHQIRYILGLDALHGRDIAYCLPVAAIKSKGDTNTFRIVVDDLEPVGTLSQARLFDSDAAVVPTLYLTTSVLLHEEAMLPHDLIDPLAVRGRIALGF